MTDYSVSRDQWHLYVNEELQKAAPCNIGGQVRIDPSNRTATVTVEVYYTSNSTSNTNYLNVIMLQDSILGSQVNGGSNPSQIVDGQYCHMHILRDAVTPSWGDAISPTTAGTLITKTYEYQIPQSIGSPNGVTVDLDNISFLAFVTEKYEGTPTQPVLNVNELYTFQGTDQDVYPTIVSLGTSSSFSCSDEKYISVTVNNSGLDDINSLEFDVTIDNGTPVHQTWQGNIPSYQTAVIDVTANVPAGTHNVNVKLVKANNIDFNDSESITISNDGWEEYEMSSAEEEFTIEVMQDKYGNQITWELLASDNTVLASGGTYAFLSGSSATELHQEKVNIQAGDCIKFVIRDDFGNGICCQFGDGYYRILDGNDNVVLDGDGAFGSEASHIISITASDVQTENISAQICEGESYTEYGFNIVDAEAGTHQEQNVYDGVMYILTLVVLPSPEITIDGDTEISEGESTVLTANGADSYVWSTGETTESITVSPDETTTYSVVGTKDGCEGTAEITVNVIVGVEENSTDDVKIYPNPTQNELKIECKGMQTISIFLPSGQTINTINVNSDNYSLDMNDYKSGVYYMRIVGENGTLVRTIMKM